MASLIWITTLLYKFVFYLIQQFIWIANVLISLKPWQCVVGNYPSPFRKSEPCVPFGKFFGEHHFPFLFRLKVREGTQILIGDIITFSKLHFEFTFSREDNDQSSFWFSIRVDWTVLLSSFWSRLFLFAHSYSRSFNVWNWKERNN